MMRLLTAVAAAFALLALAMPATSEARTGGIRLDIGKAGLLVGVQNGTGTLTLNRRRYPLQIGGVGFGATAGFSRAQLAGRVYNIRRASDIAGRYTAGAAGLTVIGGGKVVRLRNERGVVLELSGPQVGLEVTLDVSGMQVALR